MEGFTPRNRYGFSYVAFGRQDSIEYLVRVATVVFQNDSSARICFLSQSIRCYLLRRYVERV
jgi:hypothetical protein